MDKPEPVIRLTRPTDISALQNLDLKSYPYPLSLQEWQDNVAGSGKLGMARIIIVEVLRKSVGYAMWTIDRKNNGIHLERIGVTPKFRRKGMGRLLVESCVLYACEKDCEEIKIVVPHIHCNVDNPDDVSAFLAKLRFNPTGDIVSDWKIMYGELVDGYVFARKVDVTP